MASLPGPAVRKRVLERGERVASVHLELEGLAGALVLHGHGDAVRLRAPEQAHIDAVIPPAIELAAFGFSCCVGVQGHFWFRHVAGRFVTPVTARAGGM